MHFQILKRPVGQGFALRAIEQQGAACDVRVEKVIAQGSRNVVEAAEERHGLEDVFINAVARPSTIASPNYAEVSQVFSSAVHDVLTGAETAENALAIAALDIQDITGLETGQP